jgi:hypothetical protein
MNRKYRCINQKLILFILFIIILTIFSFYEVFFLKPQQPYIPHVSINRTSISNQNVTFKKISIAYYTTVYGTRTDSRSKIFNDNLKQICDILDPEDYPLADSVFVSLVDFVRFPSSSSNGISYRSSHQSQLWILHSEESPRNSYRTAKMNDITELDDWFNLTATFKPESDFHIQYRVGFAFKSSIHKKIKVYL